MKNLFALCALATATSAAAAVESHTRVLRDETTIIALELTPATVFCTERGYGVSTLKISVPDLDWLATFDHRVVGESQPCIAGGACLFAPPSGLITNERIAVVPIRVTLSEQLAIDREAKVCQRTLVEKVASHIRGINFDHYRQGDAETVDMEKCIKTLGL